MTLRRVGNVLTYHHRHTEKPQDITVFAAGSYGHWQTRDPNRKDRNVGGGAEAMILIAWI